MFKKFTLTFEVVFAAKEDQIHSKDQIVRQREKFIKIASQENSAELEIIEYYAGKARGATKQFSDLSKRRNRKYTEALFFRDKQYFVGLRKNYHEAIKNYIECDNSEERTKIMLKMEKILLYVWKAHMDLYKSQTSESHPQSFAQWGFQPLENGSATWKDRETFLKMMSPNEQIIADQIRLSLKVLTNDFREDISWTGDHKQTVLGLINRVNEMIGKAARNEQYDIVSSIDDFYRIAKILQEQGADNWVRRKQGWPTIEAPNVVEEQSPETEEKEVTISLDSYKSRPENKNQRIVYDEVIKLFPESDNLAECISKCVRDNDRGSLVKVLAAVSQFEKTYEAKDRGYCRGLSCLVREQLVCSLPQNRTEIRLIASEHIHTIDINFTLSDGQRSLVNLRSNYREIEETVEERNRKGHLLECKTLIIEFFTAKAPADLTAARSTTCQSTNVLGDDLALFLMQLNEKHDWGLGFAVRFNYHSHGEEPPSPDEPPRHPQDGEKLAKVGRTQEKVQVSEDSFFCSQKFEIYPKEVVELLLPTDITNDFGQIQEKIEALSKEYGGICKYIESFSAENKQKILKMILTIFNVQYFEGANVSNAFFSGKDEISTLE